MKLLIRRILIIISFFGLAACVTNQKSNTPDIKINHELNVSANTLISAELLIEELATIKKKLLSIHPEPFSRYSQQNFEQQIELLTTTLNKPLTRAEFYLRVAPLLASLKDIHSFVHLPKENSSNQSTSYSAFPLAVIVDNNKVFVAADLSDENEIATGAELVSINKTPINFILKVMQQLTPKETDSGQSIKIQMSFSQLLSAIGIVGENFNVEFLWHGEILQASLSGLNLSDDFHPKTTSYYGFSILNQTTALLWLNDFNEQPEVFNEFLNEKFEEIQQHNINNLILDLRFNSGGLTDNLKNLLSRLIDEPIQWADKATLKISEELKAQHQKKTRQRRKDKYSWGLKWLPLEWANQIQYSIWWADVGEKISLSLDPIIPNGSEKPANVWVLANSYCYSACSFFIASVNSYQLGKTLGEPAGSFGDYQFAYPITFELPHSHLLVTIPSMRLDFPISHNDLDNSITPQEVILRSQNDIELRRDPTMIKVLQEINAITD